MKNSGLQILEIEITNKCNLDCKHCYVDKKISKEMDYIKVKEIINSAKEMKVYRLVFTGGEPLLCKDLIEYAEYAKNCQIPQVVLMTNGLLINKENIESLKIFDLIQLSLDIPTKAEIRPNYVNELEKKIHLIKTEGINITLQATLHRSLIKDLDKINQFSIKNDVPVGINLLVPIENARNIKQEVLSPLETKEALEKILQIQKINRRIKCSNHFLFLVDKERRELLKKSPKKTIIGGCIAGIASLYVDVGGYVFPCAFLKVPVSNINIESLETIWETNEILESLRKRKEFEGKCGKCKYNSFCGGCRASALSSHGSYLDSDENCFMELCDDIL